MEREEIFIDIQLDAETVQKGLEDVQKELGRLKAVQLDCQKQQAELNKAYKSGAITSEQFATATADITKKLNDSKAQTAILTTNMKSLDATIKTLSTDGDAYGDSLNDMRKRLGDLQKTYDGLSKSARESDLGKQLQKDIEAQNKSVVALEQATGRSQRLVGTYEEALNKSLSKFGVTFDDLKANGIKAFTGLGESVKGLGKLFITPPIAVVTVVLSAILYASQKLSEAFKKNDDAGTALAKGLAALAPIGEAINKMFDKIAVGIGKVAEKVGAFVGKIFGEASEQAVKFVQAQDDLEEAERQYTMNSAKRQEEIARLRSQSVEVDKYTKKEREQFLKDIDNLEKEDLDERKKIAEEKVRLLNEEARKNRDTSDEMKNKQAQATAELSKINEQYYQRTLRITSKQAQLREQQSAEAKTRRENEIKEQEEYNKRILQLEQQLEDALIDNIYDLATQREARLEVAHKRLIASLEARQDELIDIISDPTSSVKAIEEAQKELDLVTKKINVKSEQFEKERTKIVLEEAQRRADALSKLEYTQEELRTKDVVQLSQFRLAQYEDSYARLKELTEKEYTALYGDEIAYNQALLEAQKRRDAEGINLIRLKNEQEKQLRDEKYADELLAIDNNEVAKSTIELTRAQEEHDALLAMDEQYRLQLFGSQEAYERAIKQSEDNIVAKKQQSIQAQIKLTQQYLSAFSSLTGSIISLMEVQDEQDEKSKEKRKRLALMKVAIDTGVAIAGGIAQAQSVPFPANIAAMIATVATVIANVATAVKTIKSEDASQASVSSGSSASSSSSSSSLSSTSSNTSSSASKFSGLSSNFTQTTLNEVANSKTSSSFDFETLRSVITDCLHEMPSPTLVYEEFDNFASETQQLNKVNIV